MADVNDTGRLGPRLERMIERIETEDIHEVDRPALRAYARWRRRRSGSPNTTINYLGACLLTSKRHNVPLTSIDGITEADNVLDAHEAAGCTSARSLNAKLDGLRDFWRWCESTEYGPDNARWVDLVKNVEATPKNPGTPLPDPEFILGESELVALREGADSYRDKALIAFLADTGARITLATQLKRGCLSLDGNPPTFRPNPDGLGHKGVETKDFVLKESTRHLDEYLREAHPDEHPDAPLFALRKGYDAANRSQCALARRTSYDRLSDAAENAGLDPERTKPHQIRKAAVVRMRLKHEMSWDAIQKRMEWTDQSLPEMKSIYRAIDNSDEIDMVAKELGYDESADRTMTEAVMELSQALAGFDVEDVDDLTAVIREHGPPDAG